MSEEIIYNKNTSKRQRYEEILPQLKALLSNETDIIANMANLTAVLKEVFDFFWVGFYLVKGNELVLGPFQGSLACTRIPKGKGVCGKAWEMQKSIIVPNVNDFEGHIACSSLSCSEVVVPIFYKSEIMAVLDVDSDKFNAFNETDVYFLEKIADLIYHN